MWMSLVFGRQNVRSVGGEGAGEFGLPLLQGRDLPAGSWFVTTQTRRRTPACRPPVLPTTRNPANQAHGGPRHYDWLHLSRPSTGRCVHASADTGHLGRAVWPFGRVAAVQVNQWLRWDHPPPSLGVKDSHKWCEDHFGATGTQVRADVSPPPPPIQSKRSTVLHYRTMQPSPLRTNSNGGRAPHSPNRRQ